MLLLLGACLILPYMLPLAVGPVIISFIEALVKKKTAAKSLCSGITSLWSREIKKEIKKTMPYKGFRWE